MAAQTCDLIVIGDGQGGDPLARAFAQAGRKVVLIERGDVGGTCVNTGCTPSKTLAASAEAASMANRASDYGIHAGPVRVDMSAVIARKRAVVADFRDPTEKHLATIQNLSLVRGEARFVDRRTVRVQRPGAGAQDYTSNLIVIDTGGRPAVPPIEGLASVPFLDTISIMELETLPEHLLVLGGGYSALEFGQMFARFGSRVTVIEAGEQLLGREDLDVAGAMADLLREDGIEILLKTEVARVEAAAEGIRLIVGKRSVAGSHLLVAVGRAPNTERLDPAAAGVRMDERGYIPVDEKLATNVPGIYAIGDVTGGPAFTHISYDDYRILKANLLEGGSRTTTGRLVPYVVFTDPQLGRVGLTEREASQAGRSYGVARLQMSDVARAIETSRARGFIKAIVERASGEILGCAVLGMEGGEIMAMIEIAMMAHLPYTSLRDGIFAHPTLAESLNNLFSALEDG